MPQGLPRREGFPAPAGMDRRQGIALPSAARIPRTRGDGPSRQARLAASRWDSPHPRGWTLRFQDLIAHGWGFPAPAGMDPPTVAPSGEAVGIPRTRGDGPAVHAGATCTIKDSPHPRGWTPRPVPDPVAGEGFPAPAGMDPAPSRGRPRRPRIPRTRGDGPKNLAPDRRGRSDSPHPRGWTLRGASLMGGRLGFPAPAGMDPANERGSVGSSWIPRTRGDGPSAGVGGLAAAVDSPHPRGWTPCPPSNAVLPVGFPAPAGMDPERPCSGPP